MKILMRNDQEKSWKLAETAVYDNEKELQHLLAETPELISIKEVRENASPLVFAVTEFSLPKGFVDLLAFSADGDIAVIECKLASNEEVRRKVIGQVLEYGANLWQMTYDELDERIRSRVGESLAGLVEKNTQNPDWDEELFRSNVKNALAEGNFILIIVVDEINDVLTRIVRYMNVNANQGYEFAALEMRRFHNENTEMLIHRFFGPVHSNKTVTKRQSGSQWDENRFFEELQKNTNDAGVRLTRRLLEWGQQKSEIVWGKGNLTGSFIPTYQHNGMYQLFSVYTSGNIEICFRWYKNKTSHLTV